MSAVSPGTERAQWLRLPNAQPDFPYTPGYCGAGRVIAAGEGVPGDPPGTLVAVARLPHASVGDGARRMGAPVPDGVDVERGRARLPRDYRRLRSRAGRPVGGRAALHHRCRADRRAGAAARAAPCAGAGDRGRGAAGAARSWPCAAAPRASSRPPRAWPSWTPPSSSRRPAIRRRSRARSRRRGRRRPSCSSGRRAGPPRAMCCSAAAAQGAAAGRRAHQRARDEARRSGAIRSGSSRARVPRPPWRRGARRVGPRRRSGRPARGRLLLPAGSRAGELDRRAPRLAPDSARAARCAAALCARGRRCPIGRPCARRVPRAGGRGRGCASP